MVATNYSDLRENLKSYCDKAVKNFETVVVTRKNNENVIIISEEKYNNLLENIYIRSSKNNFEVLINSVSQFYSGEVVKKTSLEFENLKNG